MDQRKPRVALALSASVFQQGGVEVIIRTLIENADTLGYLYLISPDSTKDIMDSDLGSHLSGHFELTFDNFAKPITLRLVCWLKENHIDLCHFHLLGTYDWNARSWNNCPISIISSYGIPCLTTNHSISSIFDCVGRQRTIWTKLFATSIFWWGKARQISCVCNEIAVSRFGYLKLRKWFPVIGSRLTYRYHSRLNEQMEAADACDTREILNVATIAHHKGQDLLVAAFAEISEEFPEWSLHLVGEYAEKSCLMKIKEIIRQNNLENRVHLHGPKPDPHPYYHRCEIYVQPSLVEGLGLSLQEAMFHKRACIGTDIGGIPELIENTECGILCRPNDVLSLAAALRSAMSSRQLRMTLGENARASIVNRGMTCDQMIAWHRSYYHAAIATERETEI